MSFASSRRQSAPDGTKKRASVAQRLSFGLGMKATGEAFTVDEAKSASATDIALRLGNKDPSLPCLDDPRRYTPLHIASSLGREEVVKKILSHDPHSVNSVAKLGLTPLLLAAGSRQWRIVLLLLAAGADASLKDSSDRSAYDLALEEKAPEDVLQLLVPVREPPRSKAQAQSSPFSAIVVNESMTINLREDV